MKRVDFYVQHMVRHSAEGVVLGSGQPVTFKFGSGDRRSNTPIDHKQVTELVREAAPQAIIDSLRHSGEARFTHDSSAGMSVEVAVQTNGPGDWKVEIRPTNHATAAAPTPSPGTNGGGGVARDHGPASPPAARAQPTRPQPAPPAAPPRAAAPAAPAAQPAPIASGPEPQINRLLRAMAQMSASDLHLCTGVPPMVRNDGEMMVLEQRSPFTEEELQKLLFEIIPPRSRKEFEETNDADFAHTIEGLARFRANYFRDRRGVGAVFRMIPFEILTHEQLGLPSQVLDLCYLTKGLVVVTGPTGSGKSTTLATLIDYINQNRADHIITIEDPIEFVHQNKRCLVNQREVGTHTDGFKRALRAALREDPDIVLVGEMRDLETIAIAIETAETGHLVFGTLHTISAAKTVDRIIEVFPGDLQGQIRNGLAESVRAIIAQNLFKRVDKPGRVAALEILIGIPSVRNLIREQKTHQLNSVMETGKRHGMTTLDDEIQKLLEKQMISPEEAYAKAVEKKRFVGYLPSPPDDFSDG